MQLPVKEPTSPQEQEKKERNKKNYLVTASSPHAAFEVDPVVVGGRSHHCGHGFACRPD